MEINKFKSLNTATDVKRVDTLLKYYVLKEQTLMWTVDLEQWLTYVSECS